MVYFNKNVYRAFADVVDINQILLYDLNKITGSAPRKIGIDLRAYFLNNQLKTSFHVMWSRKRERWRA